MMVFGLGSDDRGVTTVVVDEDESLSVFSNGWRREQLKVEEHLLADIGRR
jgi:hypothetical protein